ncbi:MAG: hypothetical protein AAGJ10_00765 [Bacteroidota bacterium]
MPIASSVPSTSTAWPRRLVLTLGGWFGLAVLVGLSGVFYQPPAFVVGVTIWGLVAAALAAGYLVPAFRQWALTIPLWMLVLYHVTRFVGIAFLVLHARGDLPAEFALFAGWGDIFVASTAIGVALFALPATSRRRWWTVLIWNVVGLFDILSVVGRGLQLGLADMQQMAAITAFPMSLLPTFIVPLIIATHVLIFIRLRRLYPHLASAEGLV